MVRHTLKILQHLLQDFKSVSEHFTTLRSKRLIKRKVVSTHRFQKLKYLRELGTVVFSNSTLKMLTKAGRSGDLIPTPSFYLYSSSLKLK